jgi:hypothetical protein
MSKRLINILLFLLCLALLISSIKTRMSVTPPAGDRGDAAVTAGWILMSLFGALTLVFGVRALRGDD